MESRNRSDFKKQNLTEKLSLHNARLNSAKAKQEEYTQKISGLQEKIHYD